MNVKRSSRISFVFASSVLLILELAVLESDAAVCSGSRCQTNICEAQGLNCCQCKGLSSTSAVEVCACCPLGYSCCPASKPFSTSIMCCPTRSICGTTYRGCTAVIPSVPSEYSCATCDRMFLSITADDTINDLFIDGVSYTTSVTTGNAWGNVRTFEIPADAKVIATSCNDTARVVAGVLASTTNDYLITNSAWKCTTQSYTNWNQPTYVDSFWPDAVIEGPNTALDIHGPLPSISSAASWIWTENHTDPTIDTRVFCRGRFPTSVGCNLKYGNCSNLCLRQNKICCGCELNGLGPSIVCNCCPRDYRCCRNPSGPATCCPGRSVCQPNGQCLVYTNPVSAQFSCSNCTSTATTG